MIQALARWAADRWHGARPLPRTALRRLVGDAPIAIIAGRNDAWERALRGAAPGARILRPDTADLTRLDRYCADHGIRHLGLLALPAARAQAVLAGVDTMLGHARIDLVVLDGVASAASQHLARQDYVPLTEPGRKQRGGGAFLHRRLVALTQAGAKRMLDLAALCRTHAVTPRGAIHVGAHEGQELDEYRAMGCRDVLMIEANPAVFARLEARCAAAPGLILANCAISDRIGPVRLHVTSGDQSSSLLALARHQQHYPTIVEERIVEVRGTTLDALLAERGLDAARFNILNLDIQGAELMALKGGEGLLRHVEAINVEVNFEELYQGCAQIEAIDDFLQRHGFRRVAVTCPFHRSWGDAFYVRGPAREAA